MIQCLNGEQWQGFTELFFRTTQEGFRPRRRHQTMKSEAELKDEELQRMFEGGNATGIGGQRLGLHTS